MSTRQENAMWEHFMARSITPDQLIEVLRKLPAGCQLHKNLVGNLSVYKNSKYIGYVDLYTGESDIIDGTTT